MTDEQNTDFTSRVADRSLKVAILGLGYVGLPLALTVAEQGFTVFGFDSRRARVNELKRGEPCLITVPVSRLKESLDTGRFIPTTSKEDIRDASLYILCVPTPLDRYRRPDLSAVRAATATVASLLSGGKLVALESTTYPGTTEEIMIPILEGSGLKCGVDFEVAYSPEREDPGNREHTTASIPKVVGADTARARQWATAFYSSVVSEVVEVSSCRAAEATKILENVYRAVNISLVNELKGIYDAMDIDIWEVIKAADTKPFGFKAFYPGPGMGGHCVPVDPFYLSHRAKSLGLSARFIELAGAINRRMPQYVVERLADALTARGKQLEGSRILVMGLAYKPDVSDIRESPAISVLKKLKSRGAITAYLDPLIPLMPPESGLRSPKCSLNPEEILPGNFDAGILITAHSCFDYGLLYRSLPLIVDTRNAFADIDDTAGKIVKG